MKDDLEPDLGLPWEGVGPLTDDDGADGVIVQRSTDPIDWAVARPYDPPAPHLLWHMINKTDSGTTLNGTRCWEWQGALNSNGYGIIRMQAGILYMHRHMYTQLVGPIPQGLELDHLCRNRKCCNPRHLQPVSHRINMSRANKANARLRRQQKMDAAAQNLKRLRDARSGKRPS